MNSNLQPGMMCLIIGCRYKEAEDNIGKIVMLAEYINPSEVSQNTSFGVMSPSKEPAWVVTGNDLIQVIRKPEVEFVKSGHTFVNERYLLPLPPLNEETEEKNHANLQV